MLKINNNEINIGLDFNIRNMWRNKIAGQMNKNEEKFPFHFKVIRKDEQSDKTELLFCESIPDTKGEKVIQMYVTENIIKYLTGTEVNDCNPGLYFMDYMPLENTKVLVENVKNRLDVSAFILQFNCWDIDEVTAIDLNLKNLINNDITTIKSQMKNPWKLLKGDDSYMNDVEKMFQDTFIHKEYVSLVCNKFADYLDANNLHEDADDLRDRAIVHDNSKILNKDEFRALTGIINDKSCLKNADARLSSFKQDALELHWKHNRHHPEYFTDINEMTRHDRNEMCCDWAARALQYHTNLLDFVVKRQEERFHFPELMYEEVLHNCKIISGLFPDEL